MILHLDFETRSDIDLKKQGLHNYARGRATDVMCAAYAFDDRAVELWLPGGELPAHFVSHVESGGKIHAHNATFEQEICNNVCTRLYGWPHIYSDQLVCTMAMSYAMGLPGHLGSTAAALGIDQQKDMAGQRLMLQYCQPRETSNEGKITWWDNPEDLQKIYNYCLQDVVVEREIGKRMVKLSPYERNVWLMDQRINARGIKADIPAVLSAVAIVEAEKIRLMKEIQFVSGNQIAAPTAVQQIKTFLKSHGLSHVESLAKPNVVDFLSSPSLDPDARRVLEIRKEAGRSSTAKLESMLAGAGVPDDRLRGLYQYCGANTRRWAGRRTQVQNFPRPKIKAALVERIITQLKQGISANEIDAYYGPPLEVIANCLRGFLIAGDGRDFIGGDFSSIEARVIAWLAQEQDALGIFSTHGKIYEHAAAGIFGKAIGQVDERERQVGKVAVLALGFGGGVGAFQKMAQGYGVNIAGAFETLWQLASPQQRDFVIQSFEKNGQRYEGVTKQEYIASDLTKTFWRIANPAIVSFWGLLEQGAIAAVRKPDLPFTVLSANIKFKMKGSFLWCQLPSGGLLCYPYPQLGEVELPWGGTKLGLTYMSEDGQTKKWQRFKTYGGSLAENVTQAVARDLLADAMLRLEEKSYPVVLHAHDEVVCELKKGQGSLEEMTNIMCELPLWATGLPVKASGWRGDRYRK